MNCVKMYRIGNNDLNLLIFLSSRLTGLIIFQITTFILYHENLVKTESLMLSCATIAQEIYNIL